MARPWVSRGKPSLTGWHHEKEQLRQSRAVGYCRKHLASWHGILGVQARRNPPSVDISLTITSFCCILRSVTDKKTVRLLEINTKSHEFPKDHGVFLWILSTTVADDVQKQPSFALGAQAYDLCSLLLQPTAPEKINSDLVNMACKLHVYDKIRLLRIYDICYVHIINMYVCMSINISIYVWIGYLHLKLAIQNHVKQFQRSSNAVLLNFSPGDTEVCHQLVDCSAWN